MPAHAASLAARAIDGDRRALARLLTLIDDDGAGARDAAELMAARAGRAWVLGITGVPGSGKSTLVDALLGAWLAQGSKVAVIAIDPSSPITGGAVLGDRIRMGAHGANANAFIRSFSARGELGGLSRATAAAVDCFDAAGFDRIIVETVGTGQSETRIVALADTRVVVCPPGLGDDVQAIKAGTLEIADVLAVSKGDLPLADQTAREMREMLALRRAGAAGDWKPQVLIVSAKANTGIDALRSALESHRQALGHGRRRRARASGEPAGNGASRAVASPVPGWDAHADSVPARLAHAVARTAPHAAGSRPASFRGSTADMTGSRPLRGDGATGVTAAERATAPGHAGVEAAGPADPIASRLAALVQTDGVCTTLGISFEGGGAGRAEVSMAVDARHMNFNGGCHGGAIFALADTAFGLASNSHGPVAVGIDAHITFQAPVARGDRLVARAHEVSRSRRLAVYRIDVARALDTGGAVPVSSFTGTVFIKAPPDAAKASPASAERDTPEGTVP